MKRVRLLLILTIILATIGSTLVFIDKEQKARQKNQKLESTIRNKTKKNQASERLEVEL